MNNLKKAQAISGFGKDREPLDNYPTPDIAIVELLKRESFEGIVWEPACGSGNIAKHFPNCIATDIRDGVFGQGGINFFFETKMVDCIITNPPYKFAKEFVEHSLKHASKKVAMLLKLAFLESVDRYSLFKRSPPKVVYVFSKRLPLTKEGDNRKQSSMIPFAWFVWDKEYFGRTYIEWILIDDVNGCAGAV